MAALAQTGGDYSSIETLEGLFSESPYYEFRICARLAAYFWDLGQYKQATDYLSSAHEINPKDMRTTLNLACLCAYDGNFGSAQTLLFKAQKLSATSEIKVHTDKRALCLLGNVMLDIKDTTTAGCVIDTAREIDPTDPTVLYSLGRLHAELGNHKLATEYKEAADKTSSSIWEPVRDFVRGSPYQDIYFNLVQLKA